MTDQNWTATLKALPIFTAHQLWDYKGQDTPGQHTGTSISWHLESWSLDQFAGSTKGQTWGNLRIRKCMDKSLISLLGGAGGRKEKKKKGKRRISAAASAHALYCVTKIYLLEFASVAKSLIPNWYLLAAVLADVLSQENFLPCRYLPLRLVLMIWKSASLAFHCGKYYIKGLGKHSCKHLHLQIRNSYRGALS